MMTEQHKQLDAWIDAHFDDEVRFLQALVQVPTDTPPGNNAPHAERTADLLTGFGGELGPGWLLNNKLTEPDLVIAAGFSYQVVTAHNGCLQMEVTVDGKMAHAAIPDTGIDALQGAVAILNALYAQNTLYQSVTSQVPGITHPYLNIGRIEGGMNTNVVPGKVMFKLDRRMIPEEDPMHVEGAIRRVVEDAAALVPGISVDIRRLLLARSMKPLAGNAPLVNAIQRHGAAVFGEPIPAMGTPLYTDVRLYAEMGVPGVIYGAGPRTVLESHAKRADERIALEDLRRATKAVARTLVHLLAPYRTVPRRNRFTIASRMSA